MVDDIILIEIKNMESAMQKICENEKKPGIILLFPIFSIMYNQNIIVDLMIAYFT